jgi:hypothetical protein
MAARPATSSTGLPVQIHVEANASATEPLVVVLTRNCPDLHVVYLDDGPDGADDAAVLGPERRGRSVSSRGVRPRRHREVSFPNDGWSGSMC